MMNGPWGKLGRRLIPSFDHKAFVVRSNDERTSYSVSLVILFRSVLPRRKEKKEA